MFYTVFLTAYAEGFLAESCRSDRVLSKAEDSVGLLASYPGLGPAYYPAYIAARPSFPCRYLVVSDTPFTLYYSVDDDAQTVTVFDVEWSGGGRRFRVMWQ